MTKRRSLVFDNYKGLLIFLVVFAHFLWDHFNAFPNTLIYWIVNYIYLFHMPAFIFCSGYFSYNTNSTSRKSLLKLFVYYIIFNTLMMFFSLYYDGVFFSFFSPYYSFWYLLSIIIYRLLIKYLDRIKFLLPISFVISLLVGYYPEFSNFLAISRTICYLPFFLCGYKFSKSGNFNSIREKIYSNKINILNLIILFIVFSIFGVFLVSNVNISPSIIVMNSYVNDYEIVIRLLIMVFAFIYLFLLLFIMPNTNIPLFTRAGKNSLGIYIIHRFIIIIFVGIMGVYYSNIYIIYSLIGTIIILYILSSNMFINRLNSIINSISNGLENNDIMGKTFIYFLLGLFILILLVVPIFRFLDNNIDYYESHYLSSDIKNKINDSIKISYVGDLILLKDQIKSAYNSDTLEYDFSDMFKYTKKYFEDSDYSIGVLEGPTAGEGFPYTTSNFNDGIPLYNNFPDSFVKAIKDSGIDLVTTANNHLLDRGYSGAIRTLDILDKYGISHTGSYRNKVEKDNLLIVDIEGVKIAVLSYLSFINNNNLDKVYDEYPYLSSYIPDRNVLNYNNLNMQIEKDFKRAKNSNADLILVMAHMGTQFSHETDEFQNRWNKKFSELGADIILGDHSHAVQPIEYINNTVVVNCPGNYVNSYNEYDGDATSIIDLYIDRNSKKVIGTDVIPMYTKEEKEGYYIAIPIYDIENDTSIFDGLSLYDRRRYKEVFKTVTKVILKREESIENVKKSYYFIDNNYYVENDFRDTISNYVNKKIYKLFDKSNSITFIGDSITEGSKNGFHPYYEPIIDSFSNKKIINISIGGATTKSIINDYKDIIKKTNSDLYVIAIGTNDVRYRDSMKCAMDSDEYINMIDRIVSLINKNAKIVFIAPWVSLTDDDNSNLNYTEKNNMINDYSEKLEKYCIKNKYLYINPNDYINTYINMESEKYMIDCIHPNDYYGIRLYSEAVLASSE